MSDNLNARLIESIFEEDAISVADLLRQGADINYISEGNTPLLVAIGTMNYKLVETLLDQGANPNPNALLVDTLPLNEAVDVAVQDFLNDDSVQIISLDIVKLLVKCGARFLEGDKNGKSAYDVSINYNKPAELYFKSLL